MSYDWNDMCEAWQEGFTAGKDEAARLSPLHFVADTLREVKDTLEEASNFLETSADQAESAQDQQSLDKGARMVGQARASVERALMDTGL